MEASEMISTIVSLVMIIAIMGVLGYIVARSIKSKTDLGENFVHYFTHQELFWLAAMALMLMLGEAAFVATFHPDSKLDNIPFGPRFIGHLGLNLTGYVATINAPKKVYEVLQLIPNPFSRVARIEQLKKMKAAGVTVAKVVLLILFAVFSLSISLALPILNVVILAAGIDQFLQFKLFFMDLFYDMSDFYATLPRSALGNATKLPEDQAFAGQDYSPFMDMRYPLQIVLIMVGVHYPLAFMKGMASLLYEKGGSYNILGKREEREKEGEQKDGKTPQKNFENNTISLMETVKKLLKFFGYRGDALSKKVVEANQKISAMSTTASASLGANLASVWKRVDRQTQNNFSTISKKTLQTDVKNFFKQSSQDGKGLGMTLSDSLINDDDEDDDDDV